MGARLGHKQTLPDTSSDALGTFYWFLQNPLQKNKVKNQVPAETLRTLPLSLRPTAVALLQSMRVEGLLLSQ